MAQYFLGITLPDELEKEVEAVRRRFKAPRTKPHITVIPPFSWEGSESRLLQVVREGAGRLAPFWVYAGGIGNFGSRVIFIKVESSTELMECHETARKVLEDAGVVGLKKGGVYHPHITLATRLAPSQFSDCMRELAKYDPEMRFACTHLVLFKLEETGRYKRWMVFREIPLG